MEGLLGSVVHVRGGESLHLRVGEVEMKMEPDVRWLTVMRRGGRAAQGARDRYEVSTYRSWRVDRQIHAKAKTKQSRSIEQGEDCQSQDWRVPRP